jgi:hypothetical protein
MYWWVSSKLNQLNPPENTQVIALVDYPDWHTWRWSESTADLLSLANQPSLLFWRLEERRAALSAKKKKREG